MVVQVFLGESQVLHGPGKLTAPELQELVDPDPSHEINTRLKDKTPGIESRLARLAAETARVVFRTLNPANPSDGSHEGAATGERFQGPNAESLERIRAKKWNGTEKHEARINELDHTCQSQ
jgi:hypothetical protein